MLSSNNGNVSNNAILDIDYGTDVLLAVELRDFNHH